MRFKKNMKLKLKKEKSTLIKLRLDKQEFTIKIENKYKYIKQKWKKTRN